MLSSLLWLLCFVSSYTAAARAMPMLCSLEGCDCPIITAKGVITLECISAGLTKIPDMDEFPNITSLTLSGNDIGVIKKHDFDPVKDKLDILDLSDNKIHTIETGALANMGVLTTVKLSHNLLESFSEDVLLLNSDTKSFKEEMTLVDLSHNRLRALPTNFTAVRKYIQMFLHDNPVGNLERNAFYGRLNELDILDLSNMGMTEFNTEYLNFRKIRIVDIYLDNNHFLEVNSSMLNGINKADLRTLSFRFCGIKKLGEAAFAGAIELKFLWLDGNRFEVLKARPFQDLQLTILDLANSSITDIRKTAFKRLNVSKLYLHDNNIGVIHPSEFNGIIGVDLLDLTNCNISEIRGSPFGVMHNLTELLLRNNHITDESVEIGLQGMPNIKRLVLSGNRLTRVPNINSSVSPHLVNLHVNHNFISSLSRHDLRGMDNLEFLYLSWNPLRGFDEGDDTFAECTSLGGLDMDHTNITSLPNMRYLPELVNLHADYCNLTSIPEDLCCTCSKLVFLELSHNRLTKIPTLSCVELFDLDLSHNKIESLHSDLLSDVKHLNRLDVEYNLISEIDFNFFATNIDMEFLSLKHNKLSELPSLSEMPHLINFDASYNHIKKIKKGTFVNQVGMDNLFLNDNEIDYIDPGAFSIDSNLKELNLSRNVGLREWIVPQGGFPLLAILSLEGLPHLHQVPHLFELRRAQELYFTYSYHCCIWENFIRPPEPTSRQDEEGEEGSGAEVVITRPTQLPPPKYPELNLLDCSDPVERKTFVEAWNNLYCPELCRTIGPGCEVINHIRSNNSNSSSVIGYARESVFTSRGEMHRKDIVYVDKVSCVPHNSALTPCQNLMDPWILRIAVWAIWVLALLGNGTVLFIGIATKGKLESNDLLICNLAFADFCMGVYLAFLAIVDVRTFTNSKSTFYQSALDWQLGSGCKSAGFIAVFSTELSIYILVVLTLERVYTISHTFNQNEAKKRKISIGLCIFGWFWASGLAMLPIFGINSYDKVAVCLPYVTENWWDRFYIGFILTVNLVFFLVIVASYVYIFIHACRVSPAGHIKQRRKDILSAISKIAVLILTAFCCWAPIAVIGYLALINKHLVNASEAKYFIIFVYPLNACINPFIYAIFTRGFRNKFSTIFQRSKDRVTSFPPNDRRRRSAFTHEYSMNERHSPGGEELMKLRQSRRSNSLVVQFVDSNLTTPSPTSNPPLGCNFGRRASLPPGFGSTLNSLNTIGSSSRENSHSHLPHYSLPFRLGPLYSSNNSSLPNLQEESDVDLEDETPACSDSGVGGSGCPRGSALTSSQESNLRRLSVVEEEESEGDVLGIFYPCEEDNTDSNDDDDIRDENVSVSSLEDYSDASDIPFGGGEEMGTDLDSVMARTGVVSLVAEGSIRVTCSMGSSGGGVDVESCDSACTVELPLPVHRAKAHSCEELRSSNNDQSDFHHPVISSHAMFQRERENLEQFLTLHHSSRTDMKKAFSTSDCLGRSFKDASGEGDSSSDDDGEGDSIVHRTDLSRSHMHMQSSSDDDSYKHEEEPDDKRLAKENTRNTDVPEHIKSGLILSKQGSSCCGSNYSNSMCTSNSSRSNSSTPDPLIISRNTAIQAKSTKLILKKAIETDL